MVFFLLFCQLTILIGIAEVLLQILISFKDDKDLLKSGLMLLCRLVYKGKYFSCSRLTSLGFCEKVMDIH